MTHLRKNLKNNWVQQRLSPITLIELKTINLTTKYRYGQPADIPIFIGRTTLFASYVNRDRCKPYDI
jgi:hypothetical protein